MRTLRHLLFCALATAVLACAAASGPFFFDSFEPSIDGTLWQIGPPSWQGSPSQGQEELKGDDNHLRTPGINCARAWVNYRISYNSQHNLPISFDENVYLKCWIFEDDDISYPPPWLPEEWPNGYMTLVDTYVVGDFFRIGVMGEVGRATTNYQWFDNCAVETAADGPQVLNGQFGKPLVPRRQGWRKYTILLYPYTGNAGDVRFYIDDKPVYSGHRQPNPAVPGSGAPVDNIILGHIWWTKETYWYDQVDFGTIDPVVLCGSIAEAKQQPDGAWIRLASRVVSGRFTKTPFPGYFAIEEDDSSNALWVSSSYEAAISANTHEAERVDITGIMATNGAGMRYLDAIEVTRVQQYYPQPKIIGCSGKNLTTSDTDGKLVKVWGQVINVPGSNPPSVKGQERRGDWRRYFLITDGSPGDPIKIYYDNIISGINPVPDVSNGDYVSVVGVAGTEALLIGGPAEKSVWVRKAGDLRILRDVP